MLEKAVIGENIAKARIEAGYRSQNELANAMEGVTRSNLAQIESGNQYPKLDFLTQFVKLVNCSIEDITDYKWGEKPLHVNGVSEPEGEYYQNDLVALLDRLESKGGDEELISRIKSQVIKLIQDSSNKDQRIIELLEKNDKIHQWLVEKKIINPS